VMSDLGRQRARRASLFSVVLLYGSRDGWVVLLSGSPWGHTRFFFDEVEGPGLDQIGLPNSVKYGRGVEGPAEGGVSGACYPTNTPPENPGKASNANCSGGVPTD
jgi:hypothetical protein